MATAFLALLEGIVGRGVVDNEYNCFDATPSGYSFWFCQQSRAAVKDHNKRLTSKFAINAIVSSVHEMHGRR